MKRRLLLILHLLILTVTGALAQPNINLGCTPVYDDFSMPIGSMPDTIWGCQGLSASVTPTFTLPSGFQVVGFNWVPGGASPTTGQTQPGLTTISTPSSCTQYQVSFSTIGPDLINNSQFIDPLYSNPDSEDNYCYTCMESWYGKEGGSDGEHDGHVKIGNSVCMGVANSQCAEFDGHTGTYPNLSLVVNGAKDSTVPTQEYFWGQKVMLDTGQQYQLTFWIRIYDPNVDPVSSPSPNKRPKIKVYCGKSGIVGGVGYLEYGNTIGSSVLFDGYVGGWPGCDTVWHEVTVNFTPAANQDFLALQNIQGGTSFMMDDIELHRLAAGTDTVMVCPYALPSETVSVSDAIPCAGTSITFTVHGNNGDVIHSKVTSPSGTIYPSGTISGGVWNYNYTYPNAGTVTFQTDSVQTALGGCINAYTQSVTATFEARPTIVPGLITAACPGTNAVLSYSSPTGSPTLYSVYWPGNPTGLFPDLNQPLGSTILIPISSSANGGNFTAQIVIANSYGCTDTYTVSVPVNAPPAPITFSPSNSVCVGATIQAGDNTLGGTWLPVAGTGSVSVNSSGLVTGGTSGTAYVKYTAPDGCSIQALVNVLPLPSVTLQTPSVCQGTTSALLFHSLGSTSYSLTWDGPSHDSGFVNQNFGSPANGAAINVAIPANAGPGTYHGILTLTNTNGCSNTETVVVIIKPLPSPIQGPSQVCASQIVYYTDSPSGGTWSPVSIINASSGAFLENTPGSYPIIYMAPDGCTATKTITVNPLPSPGAITTSGSLQYHFCVGTTNDTLFETVLHGSWVSSNPSVLQITSTTSSPTPTARVHALAVGKSVITYTDTNTYGCTNHLSDTIYVDTNGVANIQGVFGVCQSYTTPLFDVTPLGTWSSSTNSIATVNATTGVVTGVASGMDTITYTVHNSCGTYSTSVTVVVNMPPFITTYTRTTCQTLGNASHDLTHPVILSDTSGCVKVCAGTTVRYYANGNYGSTFAWTVLGGTIVHNYGNDSIDVQWGQVGTPASIGIYDSIASCVGTQSVCIDLIQRPTSIFTTAPNSHPVASIQICKGSTVSFINLSTADPSSPILYYTWDFGDGNYSSAINPSYTYNTPGNYVVTLVVKNACGCTDTSSMKIQVLGTTGPDIECTGVQCQGNRAEYGSSISCGNYTWSVVGGVIASGQGTSLINVVWGAPNTTTGDGYVTLQACGCPSPTTLTIPVIPTTSTIQGPDTICAKQQYEYSLPLSPGTQYEWGLISNPTLFIGSKTDYKAVIDIPASGSYTLHAWYQNPLALCGGNVDKQIYVLPAISVTGALTVCKGSTETYTINGGTGGTFHWTLTSATGTTTAGSGSGTTFNLTFNQAPGTYMLSLTGAFCFDPINIAINPIPEAIGGISGADTVCLNREFSYTAYNDTAGAIYNWQAIGGTISPNSAGNTIGVKWTSTGTKMLIVQRVNTLPPYCSGPADTLKIIQEQIHPVITGDTLPCSNSYRTYTTSYTRAETYTWTISPSTAGSVVGGSHTDTANILWSNVATVTDAYVTLAVQKCDSTITTTYHVKIQPSPQPVVTGTGGPICPGDTILFTASSGAFLYIWNFGDGSPSDTNGYNTMAHAFPQNTTNGNNLYTVKVILIPDTFAHCPISGTAFSQVTVKPSPFAYVSSQSYYFYDPTQVVSTVSNNIGVSTYQWYFNSSAIAGATTSAYSATNAGVYSIKVTSTNGCTATSNSLDLEPMGGASGCGLDNVYGSGVNNCNVVTLTGNGIYPHSHWASGTDSVGPNTATYTATVPGIYRFEYDEWTDTCFGLYDVIDTIGYIPSFLYSKKCAPSGNDSLRLMDHTAYLPFFTIDSISWYKGSTRLGSGNNMTVVFPAPGSYTITENVTATGPDGTTTCSVTNTITLPPLPPVAFTDSIGTICEGVPIYFKPTYPSGIVSYNWDFGDGSNSLLQDPQRTYSWDVLLGPINHRTVILTVTDTIGCSSSATGTMTIYPNTFNLSVSPGSETVCSPNAPITLALINGGSNVITSYLWNTGATGSTISVDTTGSYWVTVVDANKCQTTIQPASQIKVIKALPAVIQGQQYYCIGSVINLSGYQGNNVSYKWYRNDTLDGTTASIQDSALHIANYTYRLVVTTYDTSGNTYCYDTSAPYIVHVYGPSPRPVVTGPTILDCNSYSLQLSASEPVTGTYNWSDGNYGPVDNISTGGIYEVWFTNQYGCISDTTVNVPLAPSYYMQYFPSGCYSVCTSQTPVTLPGALSGIFYPWEWEQNGSVVESGDSIMSAYNITTTATYNWSLNNGLCTQVSDPMYFQRDSTCTTCTANLNPVLTCLSGGGANEASYHLTLTLTSTVANTTYMLGTNIGPVLPFSGTLSSVGTYNMALTFTTLDVPPPATLLLYVQYTLPNGQRCFEKQKVTIPSCTWLPERVDSIYNPIVDSSVAAPDIQPQMEIQTALMVFPNPATGDVTISYDYGQGKFGNKMIEVFDNLGQRMYFTGIADQHGSRKLNTAGWSDGVYIIRMDGDGEALQTQRLVVGH